MASTKTIRRIKPAPPNTLYVKIAQLKDGDWFVSKVGNMVGVKVSGQGYLLDYPTLGGASMVDLDVRRLDSVVFKEACPERTGANNQG